MKNASTIYLPSQHFLSLLVLTVVILLLVPQHSQAATDASEVPASPDAVSTIGVDLDGYYSSMEREVNKPFGVCARVKNTGDSPADHGGIAMSFPRLTATDTSMGPYNSSLADVAWSSSSTFSEGELGWFDRGDSISTGSGSTTADYLLVDSDHARFSNGEYKTLCLTLTVKQTGSFPIYVRGWMSEGGYGYDNVVRDPTSGTRDQQYFYVAVINVDVKATPQISSLSPASGPPGKRVVINGSNFGNSQQTGYSVRFAGASVPVASWSNNQIVVDVPTSTNTGSKSVVVHTWTDSNSTTFSVTDPLSVALENYPTSTLYKSIGESFPVCATVRNTSYSDADHGGIAFSFPQLTSVDSSSGMPPYTSSIASVSTGSTSFSTSSEITYYDRGDQIVGSTGSRSADYLLVDADESGFGDRTSESLCVTLTVHRTGTFPINVRGFMSTGGAYGYDHAVRDPSSASTYDQQGYPVYRVNVNVQEPTPSITSLNPSAAPRGTQIEINGSNFGNTRGTYGRVEFGSTYVATVKSWSDTKIEVEIPRTISTGNTTVRVRNDNQQTSNSFALAVRDDPNAYLIGSPELVCPTSVEVGEAFFVTARLRNAATGTAENGGVSISFPDFNVLNNDPEQDAYRSNLGLVETVNSDGAVVTYFDVGDVLDTGPAEHLVVESNYQGWTYGMEKELQLRVTPQQVSDDGKIKVRLRGTLSWGGDHGWTYTDRDPSMSGTDIEPDQQGYYAHSCEIDVMEVQSEDIPVLMYHKIQPNIIDSDYWLTSHMFDAQLDALQAYGYETLTLDEYLAIRNGSQVAPTNPVIITIDDGYRNLYDHAYPVLQDHSMTATAFLLTGKITDGCDDDDRDDSSWDTDPTEQANPVDHLCWDEVRAMDTATIRLESHSVSHPQLSTLTATEQRAEVANSKTAIESQISGYVVNHFSYPFGDGASDPTIQAIVADEEYGTAVAAWGGIANTGSSPMYAIPRTNVSMTNSVDLDPANPDAFFMHLVDPSFPLPDISMLGVYFQTTDGTDRTTFYPGETVRIIVNAENSGDAANVIASLELDSDTDGSTPSLYDSHQLSPSEDVALTPFAANSSGQFLYEWTIPDKVASGTIYYSFGVHDAHYVLGYKYTGWHAAFTIGDQSSTVMLDVPYYYQYYTPWCNITALSMLLKYYGIERRNWEIAAHENFRWDYDDNTDWWRVWYLGEPLAQYIVDTVPGAQVYYQSIGTTSYLGQDGSNVVAYLKGELSAGRPVWLGSTQRSHAILVVGYDQNHVYIHDPSGAFFTEATYPGLQYLAQVPMLWTDFVDTIVSEYRSGWVETIAIHEPSGVAQNTIPTVNVGPYTYYDPVFDDPPFEYWPWAGYTSVNAGLSFRSGINGVERALQFQYDGSIPPYLGYTYVPTEDDGSGGMKPGNPNNYYQPDSHVGYAATLADHLNLELYASSSGVPPTATVAVWINEMDSNWNMVNTNPTVSKERQIDFGSATSNKFVALVKQGISGSSIWTPTLGSLLDKDSDGLVDNPSGNYQMTVRVVGNNGETDRFIVDFAVASSDYAGMGIPTIPPPTQLAEGETVLLNFQIANWGTVSDAPTLSVSQIDIDPFVTNLGLNVYLDENYDGIADGPPIGSHSGIQLPDIPANTFLNLLLELNVPSDLSANQEGGIRLLVHSGFDSEEEAFGEFDLTLMDSPTCYALTRTKTGSGAVPAASPTSSSGCSTGQYVAGEVIQLTVAPDSGWHVGSWSGTDNDTSTATTNQVTMPAADHMVTISYVEVQEPCYTLTRTRTGSGAILTASPTSSSGCPTNQFLADEVIQLAAVPDPGWRVDGWSGTDDDTSTATTNQVTMPATDWTVTVHYEEVPTLSIPTLVSPADGSTTTDDTPTFDWNSSSGATQYQLQVDDTADFSSPLVDATTHETIHTPVWALTPGVYYWRVRAGDSDGHWSSYSGAWALTVSGVNTPLFEDDFSTGRDWIDESGGAIYRDAENEWLFWHVTRAEARRYYIPIRAQADVISLTYRFKITEVDGNGDVWFGLVENMNGGYTADAMPTGFFAVMQHGGGMDFARHFISYADRQPDQPPSGSCGWWSCVDPDTWLDLEAMNVWRRIDLTIEDGAWEMKLYDDGDTLLDSTSGTMSGTHSRYQYLMVFREIPGGWEWQKGFLDDIQVYGTTANDLPELSGPAPANGAAGIPITGNLAWTGGDADGDDVTYDVFLDAGDPAPQTLVCDDVTTTSCNPAGDFTYETEYYWQVIATDSYGGRTTSPVWRFTTENNPFAPPALLEPGNGTTTSDTMPAFSWNPAVGATQYNLQVDDSSDFSSPVIDTTTSNTAYTPSSPLSEGTYYWQVRAGDGTGNWSSYSDDWSVTISSSNSPPNTPSNAAPANGATIHAGEVVLSWEGGDPDGDSVTYDVYLDPELTVGTFFDRIQAQVPTTLVCSDITSTTCDVGQLEAKKRYYWMVQASDGVHTVTGSVWRFQTVSNLASPSSLSVSQGSSTSLLLSWTDNSNDESEFRIERSLDGTGEWVEIGSVPADVTDYEDMNLDYDTYYDYRIRAYRSSDDLYSTYSNVAGASTGSAPCNALTRTHTGSGTDPAPSPTRSASCPAAYQYTSGEAITLTANPESGWLVDGWSGTTNDESTSSTNSLVMPASDHTVSVTYVFALSAPTLVSPANGSTTPDLTPTFTWNASADATQYQLQLDNNANFSSPAIDVTIGNTSYTPASTLADGTYYWRVRAGDGSGTWSSYSDVWEVTVDTDSSGPTCHTLILEKTGSGAVPTTSPTNSSDCDSGQYVAGEVIQLTAAPDSGWQVSRWSGTDDDTSTETTNQVTMPDEDRTVTVHYEITTPETGTHAVYLPFVVH